MIRRRIFAAIVLLVFAIGSALYWNDGEIVLPVLGANLVAGSVGFLWLHHRWKRREERQITAKQAEDIFS